MKTCICNGRVIDPANHLDAIRNVLIENGKVLAVSAEPVRADEVIDATGKIVCPGFVDIHMHEDPIGADGRLALSIFPCMLRMGVTTAVGGNCGSNTADPLAYFDLIDRQGAPVNVALLAGHSSARRQAGVLDKYQPASPEQKEQIRQLLSGWLADGCAGLSFGLRYVPGTDHEEFMLAASAAEGTGKLIASHVRNDADYIFKSIAEVAEAAQTYHLPLQISHIGSMAGFGQMREVLQQAMQQHVHGLDIAFDCYPYEAFCTELGATTYDDGWLERYHCDYGVLEYCEGQWQGERATPESFARLRAEQPDMLTVCHVMRHEDIVQAMQHPLVMIGSDGIFNDGQGHPRAAGTFPRVFAQYVRSGVLNLYDAIEKMTSKPAERLHLAAKGSLSVGADADVVIFDPDVIRDQATFNDPMAPPVGIDRILIGGKTVLQNGQILSMNAGRAVRVQNR